MEKLKFNFPAIAVITVLHQVWGFIWYGFLIWLSFFFMPYATHQQFIGFGGDLLVIDGAKELVAFLFTGLILTALKKYEDEGA